MNKQTIHKITPLGVRSTLNVYADSAMSAVETLALVLLHVVVAVLPLGGRQTHGLRLRLKLLDAADSGQVAIQFGGHIAGLQQFGAEI